MSFSDAEVISVISGNLFEKTEGFFDEYYNKNNPLQVPRKLKNRFLIGLFGRQGRWAENRGIVGNLNIFRGLLSVEKMISITSGKDCGLSCDFLSWNPDDWKS